MVWTGVAAAVLAIAVGDVARAVTTRTWTTATYKDFDEGEADHAVMTSLGEVLPGTATTRVNVETEAIWTAVRGRDGTIYAGGVTDGTIYAIAGGKKRKLAAPDPAAPWIGSLALAANGTLYAGTLATGSVWAIDTRSGKATRIARLGKDSAHVWALVLDPAGRTLWAATGTAGKLWSIDLVTRKARLAWDSREKHLLSAARAADGALWIGTSDEAILYRFEPRTAKARAIADFAGSEVKAVVATNGGFIAAANEFEQKTTGPPAPAPTKGPKGEAAKAPVAGPGADKAATSGKGAPRGDARKGKGALFRVEADGRIEQLHALAEGYYQSLAAAADGSVFAASASQGRIYRVRRDRTVVTAFDVTERQVNAVLVGPQGVAFATGDTGAVYVGGGPAKDARYTSKVFDAKFPARWGKLRWRGTGVSVQTRSGNTAKPDRGWSAWQRVVGPVRAGGDATIARIVSPPGRYLQYRVALGLASGAVLREVNVYHLPQNQRPRVTDVTVDTAGDDKALVTTARGVTKPRSPIVKLNWKVDNPDDDELEYHLELRAEGVAEWRELPTGDEPLTATSFDWNTEPLPDGYYRVRVTTTDRRTNPEGRALEDSFVSPPFLIDNLKPQLVGLAVKNGVATGRSVDSFSRIDEIAYQIDAEDWVVVFPQDGIFDTMSETFSFRLPAGLAPGTHTLSVRVADEGHNIGAASLTFRVGRRAPARRGRR